MEPRFRLLLPLGFPKMGRVPPNMPTLMTTNRLSKEKSPYLLQHQHNPVDWHPWGDEAFEKARREEKPIFLSIGYSTCHWCHVMEHESFENEAIAALLNKHYVSIKVDREERPDVDRIYMTYVQATTGSGGWPMSVFLTPELEPFFGGTYFPPVDRWGKAGFPTILQRLATLWSEERHRLLAHSAAATESLREAQAEGSSTPAEGSVTLRIDEHLLAGGYEQIARTFDGDFPGFSHAPKFPRPVTLDYLLRYSIHRSAPGPAREHARDMALSTLDAMASGGIHDHLGGGFHRYSVDRFWHVPHFEKMLYDQAQLAMAYIDAWQLTHSPLYETTIHDTLKYVLHDMTSPEGGFFSAEDADSLPTQDAKEKTEGAFYVWTRDEIDAVLALQPNPGSRLSPATLFSNAYGVLAEGNSPEGSDPQGELSGKNTLIRRRSDEELASEAGVAPETVRAMLASSRALLLAEREKRPRPHLDDKILSAWNGLMISAFARASTALRAPAYLQAAERAARFLQENLWDGKTLYRSYREGRSNIAGFADDYAFLIQGLLDLYTASGTTKWLDWAITLQQQADLRFHDASAGGYFSTEADAPHLLFRVKEDYDGAEPSPNSVATLNLLRLADLLRSREAREKAERTLNSFTPHLSRMPSAAPLLLAAAMRALDEVPEFQFIGKPPLLQLLGDHYLPHKTILHLTDEASLAWFLPSHPELEGLRLDPPRLIICKGNTCLPPIDSEEAFRRDLDFD